MAVQKSYTDFLSFFIFVHLVAAKTIWENWQIITCHHLICCCLCRHPPVVEQHFYSFFSKSSCLMWLLCEWWEWIRTAEFGVGQQTDEPTLTINLHKSQGRLQIQLIFLCRFIARSSNSHIAHCHLVDCYKKYWVNFWLRYSLNLRRNRLLRQKPKKMLPWLLQLSVVTFQMFLLACCWCYQRHSFTSVYNLSTLLGWEGLGSV